MTTPNGIHHSALVKQFLLNKHAMVSLYFLIINVNLYDCQVVHFVPQGNSFWYSQQCAMVEGGNPLCGTSVSCSLKYGSQLGVFYNGCILEKVYFCKCILQLMYYTIG